MANKLSDKEFRKCVFNKCNGRCSYCGCVISVNNFHIDHIEPKRRYKYNRECSSKGSDDFSNLTPSCTGCNACKGDLTVGEFRSRVLDRVRRLNEYSTEYQMAKRFGLVIETDIEDIIFYFETLNDYE